jgi:hypothetical protein
METSPSMGYDRGDGGVQRAKTAHTGSKRTRKHKTAKTITNFDRERKFTSGQKSARSIDKPKSSKVIFTSYNKCIEKEKIEKV